MLEQNGPTTHGTPIYSNIVTADDNDDWAAGYLAPFWFPPALAQTFELQDLQSSLMSDLSEPSAASMDPHTYEDQLRMASSFERFTDDATDLVSLKLEQLSLTSDPDSPALPTEARDDKTKTSSAKPAGMVRRTRRKRR